MVFAFVVEIVADRRDWKLLILPSDAMTSNDDDDDDFSPEDAFNLFTPTIYGPPPDHLLDVPPPPPPPPLYELEDSDLGLSAVTDHVRLTTSRSIVVFNVRFQYFRPFVLNNNYFYTHYIFIVSSRISLQDE